MQPTLAYTSFVTIISPFHESHIYVVFFFKKSTTKTYRKSVGFFIKRLLLWNYNSHLETNCKTFQFVKIFIHWTHVHLKTSVITLRRKNVTWCYFLIGYRISLYVTTNIVIIIDCFQDIVIHHIIKKMEDLW